jgi:hypothetical protein
MTQSTCHEIGCSQIYSVLQSDLQAQENQSLRLILDSTRLLHKNAFLLCSELTPLHAFAVESGNNALVHKIESGGFSIKAAADGIYSAIVDTKELLSSETYPLIIHYDRRVAVRFVSENRDLYIVTDEYWGIPYLIYDANTCSYFQYPQSTIPAMDGLRMLIAAIQYFKCVGIHLSAVNIAHPVGLLLGGNNNIAHFFWNYLGAACVLNGLTKAQPCEYLFSLSDNFQMEDILISISQCHYFSDLSRLSWQERLFRLTPLVGKLCFVRLSGHGLMPPIVDSLLKSVERHKLSFDSIKLVLTVRSTSRKLDNQIDKYLHIANACKQVYGDRLEILIDGPCRQSGELEANANHPEYEVIKYLLAQLINIGVHSTNLMGLSLEEQMINIGSAQCILTYISGSNAKFLGLVDCPIICMAPDSQVLRNGIRSYSQLPPFVAATDVACHFNDAYFFQDLSYAAYLSKVNPVITFRPQDVVSSDLEQNFYSDFDIDLGLLTDLVVRALRFSVPIDNN